jgi:hypothetical protein
MAYTIRNLSFYGKNGAKLKLAQSGSVNLMANGESMIIDGSWAGHSQAAVTASISIDTVITVEADPVQFELIDSIIKKRYTECLAGIVLGKIWTWDTCKVTEADVKWDNKAGTATGSFKIESGEPKIT